MQKSKNILNMKSFKCIFINMKGILFKAMRKSVLLPRDIHQRFYLNMNNLMEINTFIKLENLSRFQNSFEIV